MGMMFCMFPTLDALKRMRLTKALLLVCGDPVVRSEIHVTHPLLNIKLSLDSTDDLKAMWVLSQLLGPMYGRGQSLRYCHHVLLRPRLGAHGVCGHCSRDPCLLPERL